MWLGGLVFLSSSVRCLGVEVWFGRFCRGVGVREVLVVWRF